MKLTSTNRPFGLSIELTPRSNEADFLLTSLVSTANQFRVKPKVLYDQLFGASLQPRSYGPPGETIRTKVDAADPKVREPPLRHRAGDLSQLNSIRNTGLDLRRDPNTFQTNTLAGSPGMGSPGRAVVARHGVEVRQVNFMVKPNGRLVLVSFTHYCAFTPSLSNT